MGISFNLELPFSLLSCLDSPGQMSLDKSSVLLYQYSYNHYNRNRRQNFLLLTLHLMPKDIPFFWVVKLRPDLLLR